ncbi:hypothetical protein TUM17569_26460 [Klebsiella oxytoca]|nr:hypothetical protein TUM17568_18900 [Klebsiella oxytoca]GJK97185.1 hypothetical protein TUM17569_26460 [Klebsiella oxytoca]
MTLNLFFLHSFAISARRHFLEKQQNKVRYIDLYQNKTDFIKKHTLPLMTCSVVDMIVII